VDIDKKIIYQNLREEIMFNIGKQDVYIVAACTAAIALWTIALNKPNSWIALIAMIVLFPISLRVCDCRYSTAFLSAYIAIFIEQKNTSGWEYAREVYYDNNKRIFSSNAIYLVSKYTFVLLSIVNTVMFWKIRNFNIIVLGSAWWGWSILVCQLVVIVIQAILGYKYCNTSKLKQKFMINWEKIYQQSNYDISTTKRECVYYESCK